MGGSLESEKPKLIKHERRFISVSSEQLFGNLTVKQLPEMKSWMEYIHARYPWVKEQT